MTAKKNKGAEGARSRVLKAMDEAMCGELEAMEAMAGEFGESEAAALDGRLIPDEELELVAGGIQHILPVLTTASPGRNDAYTSSGPLVR